ncbi:MAG: ISNCY family transposase [Spirochaetaceae bacterium]|jgi:hypothetical protein|nr:ISNCY family transposase [Spirochaetaceae bacterium]
MGQEIFEELLGRLEGIGREVPDGRRWGYDQKYEIKDALKSAFGVFFFQHPSMLQFQRAMQEKRKRNNVTTILKVAEIPSDTQIKTLIDNIEPAGFDTVFSGNLGIADKHGIIDKYRVLDDGVLIALDGVWYHSSENIHCKHCLHKEIDGKVMYYHSIVAGTIVKPGDGAVLPVMPEMITNEDGSEKQDCEINATKRWLKKHGKEYKWLKATLLGDDLFSNYPMCMAVLEQGMSFIFTCKPKSHPWLTETITNSYLDELSVKNWKGKNHHVGTYKWLNGVEIRDDKKTLLVNYLYLEIKNKETGKVGYKNGWVTNKTITKENCVSLAAFGRARWKIENEHNNVLKNHGYNLEHNFGHGKNHASEIFCLLNLLSFQFHTILGLVDEGYQSARASISRRDEFFNHLRAALRYGLHDNWQQFIIFVRHGPPDG